jgi:hypothetical protein
LANLIPNILKDFPFEDVESDFSIKQLREQLLPHEHQRPFLEWAKPPIAVLPFLAKSCIGSSPSPDSPQGKCKVSDEAPFPKLCMLH